MKGEEIEEITEFQRRGKRIKELEAALERKAHLVEQAEIGKVQLSQRIHELKEENKRLEYEIGELRMYFSRLPKEHFEAFRRAVSDE